MKKIYYVVIALFLFIGCSNIVYPNKEYRVVNGVFDFSVLHDGIAQLGGEWAYEPLQFVSPAVSFSSYTLFNDPEESWFRYKDGQVDLYSYCTYAVKIVNLEPNKEYGLKVPGICSAAKIFINGKKVLDKGLPSRLRLYEKISTSSDLVYFKLDNRSEIVIVVHISNHFDIKTGFDKPFLFGEFNDLKFIFFIRKNLYIFITAILSLLGVFFVVFYFFRGDSPATVFFGLLCIVLSIRMLCYEEFILYDFFLNLNPEIIFRLGYCTFSIGCFFLILLIHYLFSDIVSKRINFIITIPFLIYTIICIVLPMWIFPQYLVYFQIYCLLVGIYIFIFLIIAMCKREPNAIIFFISFSVALMIAINDIAVAQRLYSGVFLSQVIGIAFALPLSVGIIKQFSNAFTSLENLNAKIEQSNLALSRFVPYQFLTALGKTNIIEVKMGDGILADFAVMFVRFKFKKIQDDIGETFLRFNKVFNSINSVIDKNGGFVDKYFTNGVMLLFEKQVTGAINAGFEIAEMLNNFTIDGIKVEMDYTIGLNYGKLMLGAIGESKRIDTTVISDIVNVAYRFHDFALQNNLHFIVSENVKNQFEKEFTAFPFKFILFDNIKLRGKTSETLIYEVKKNET